MKQVELHTDGACSGNPGPGGWAAILVYGKREKTLVGGERNTTNNRMELMAVIQGLEALKEPCQADIHTDSKYVYKGMTGRLAPWKSHSCQTTKHTELCNKELLRQLEHAAEKHGITWLWGSTAWK